MSYHARPLQTTTGTAAGPHIATPPAPPEAAGTTATPSPEPEASIAAPTPRAVAPRADAADSPLSAAPEPAAAVSWYRRERWLAVSAAAFLPMLAALAVPDGLRLPLVALSAVLMLVGIGLLLRRGLFEDEEEESPSPTGGAGAGPRARP